MQSWKADHHIGGSGMLESKPSGVKLGVKPKSKVNLHRPTARLTDHLLRQDGGAQVAVESKV